MQSIFKKRFPQYLVIIYICFGVLWILLTDYFVSLFFKDNIAQINAIQSVKGVVFIILSSLLLYIVASYFTNEINNQEHKYIKLFKDHPQPMWIYDIETYEIVKVNNAAINTYGYTKSEFLQLKLFDLRPPSVRKKMLNDLKKSKTELISNNGVKVHMKKNGQQFYVNIISFATTHNFRSSRLVLASDIDEIQQSTEQLTFQNYELERFKEALDYSTILTITNSEGNIEYANTGYSKITGFTSEELVGKNFRFLESSKQDDEFYTDLWNTISKGEVWSGELSFINKAGNEFWLFTQIVPCKNLLTQKVEKFISVSFEVTDRKHTLTELETKNKKLQKITWSYSHEIRKPLSSILGLINLIEFDSDRRLEKDIIQHLKMSAEELDNVIKELSKFSSQQN